MFSPSGPRLQRWLLCPLALLTACATAPPIEGWSEDSMAIRDGLEHSLAELEHALVVAFPGADQEEIRMRTAVEESARTAYLPMVDAWSAFAAYSAEAEAAITDGGAAGTRRLRDAFHTLHVALLETRMTEDFGINAETHRGLLASIDRAGTPSNAFLMLHPFVEHLALSTSNHAEQLEQQLRRAEADALLALQNDAAALVQQRTELRSEESRLADLMRRRAAGVGEVSGNPGKELRSVRVSLEDVDLLEAAHASRRVQLADAFQTAREELRRGAGGFAAWGAAHARVAEAIRAGHASVDFSRLHELATSFNR